MAEYLVQHHGFTRLYMEPPSPPLEKEGSADFRATSPNAPVFDNASSLLEYVTKQWQQRWVTTDVRNESVLGVFLRRPSFLLVSVDAPVSLRWKRLMERYVPTDLSFPLT